MKAQIQNKINELSRRKAEQWEAVQVAEQALKQAEANHPLKALREAARRAENEWYQTHKKLQSLENCLAELDAAELEAK